MCLTLKNKNIVVTGAARGIGQAIAERMAREGGNIAVVDILEKEAADTARQLEELGSQAKSYTIDLKKIDLIKPLYDSIVSDFGSIDIIVHAAGIISIKPFLELTENQWDNVMDLNAKALFFSIQQVAKQMMRTGGGRIINIASITAKGSRPDYAAYAASKAAVLSITKSAAAAFATSNIRVNAICPGIINTSMWDAIDNYYVGNNEKSAGQAVQEMIEKVPLQRTGTVEEIAGLVCYLAQPEADYITGQSINIDGGIVMD